MRVTSRLIVGVLAALPAVAVAGMNRNYLVPVYESCEAFTCPAHLSSAYTFDTIILSSSQQQYTAPKKLALAVSIRGLKDPAGNPVNGTLELKVKVGRITQSGVTFMDDSPSLEAFTPRYLVDVKNGNGRARFATPDNTPAGLVVNSLSSPVLYDPEGKPLASTGTQAKP